MKPFTPDHPRFSNPQKLRHCFSFPFPAPMSFVSPFLLGHHSLCPPFPRPAPILGAEGLRLLLLSGGCCSLVLSSFSVSYPSPDLKFINANPS